MKYRKKPVVIEARQLPIDDDQDDIDAFLQWADDVGFSGHFTSDYDGGIAIETREGVMRADPGDWVIKGVKEEFYPCKPDIFEATYEPVEDSLAQSLSNRIVNTREDEDIS